MIDNSVKRDARTKFEAAREAEHASYEKANNQRLLGLVKEIGGHCGVCNRAKTTLMGIVRCSIKKMKIVNKNAICHIFEKRQ